MVTKNSNRKIQWFANKTAGGQGAPPMEYLEMKQAIAALKTQRQEAGVSLTEVAKRSGIDLAALSRLENGRQPNPTLETLSRYAAALGKQFLWIIADLSFQPSSPSARPNQEDH